MVADLAVTLNQRRWVCIIDPALLLLTPFGPPLVQGLGALTELWIPRSFWRTLDDSVSCSRDPQRLVPASWLPDFQGNLDTCCDALRTWERLRARSDIGGLRFRYVGDSLMSSALPEQREPDLVQRFDQIEAALQMQLGPWKEQSLSGHDAWLAAIDLLALTASLDTAFVLTLVRGTRRLPAPAAALIDCALAPAFQRIDEDQSLLPIEQEEIRRLLVQAGAAPLVWAGLDLAIGRLVAPHMLQMRTAFDDMVQEEDADLLHVFDNRSVIPPWHDACVYWYPI